MAVMPKARFGMGWTRLSEVFGEAYESDTDFMRLPGGARIPAMKWMEMAPMDREKLTQIASERAEKLAKPVGRTGPGPSINTGGAGGSAGYVYGSGGGGSGGPGGPGYWGTGPAGPSAFPGMVTGEPRGTTTSGAPAPNEEAIAPEISPRVKNPKLDL